MLLVADLQSCTIHGAGVDLQYHVVLLVADPAVLYPHGAEDQHQHHDVVGYRILQDPVTNNTTWY